MECDACQAGAITEGEIQDPSDAVANRDARQAGAGIEGARSDSGDAIRNCDARQAGAITEGALSDNGDAVANRDARQAGAALEGIRLNEADTIRDDVIGTCLGCRIGMQDPHLRFDEIISEGFHQNPIDPRVSHVSRANLNRCQAGAITEGEIPDGSDVVANRDAREAAATKEGIIPDGGDRLSLNCVGNHQFTSGVRIAFPNGDFAVSCGPRQVAKVCSVEWCNC